MKLAIVTPTGDRHASLKRQKKYIERSPKGSLDLSWIVVDDGKVPFNPGGCDYRRREPDGPNSLERNLKFIGPLDADYVMIWEDDEWYGPNRILDQTNLLHKSDKHLHGYGKGIYYHMGMRAFRQMHNMDHASLCETIMTGEFWNKYLENHLSAKGSTVFIDMKMWHTYGPDHGFLTLNEPVRCSLGLKGMPGRFGMGGGHAPNSLRYSPDPNLDFFLEIVPDADAREIIEELESHKDTNFPV